MVDLSWITQYIILPGVMGSFISHGMAESTFTERLWIIIPVIVCYNIALMIEESKCRF